MQESKYRLMARSSSTDTCILIPAFDAEATLASVIDDLRAELPAHSILVVDDGSRDATAKIAEDRGCIVLKLDRNRGKGTALVRGFEAAAERGFKIAITVDADGQHPASEARRVLEATADEDALVLGVRDLGKAGAPRANRFSNGISNFFLSRFAARALRDTQCGLRRYPLAKTLALRARGRGYDYEAAVLLRAIWSGMNVVEQPVRVLYPAERTTHFDSKRDPWRIVRTVMATVGDRTFGVEA